MLLGRSAGQAWQSTCRTSRATPLVSVTNSLARCGLPALGTLVCLYRCVPLFKGLQRAGAFQDKLAHSVGCFCLGPSCHPPAWLASASDLPAGAWTMRVRTVLLVPLECCALSLLASHAVLGHRLCDAHLEQCRFFAKPCSARPSLSSCILEQRASAAGPACPHALRALLCVLLPVASCILRSFSQH